MSAEAEVAVPGLSSSFIEQIVSTSNGMRRFSEIQSPGGSKLEGLGRPPPSRTCPTDGAAVGHFSAMESVSLAW